MALEILVKYFNPDMPKLQKTSIGDWIDLRASKKFVLEPGMHVLIPLGVAIKLPPGYEAILAPRSSSFKNWGVIQANSIGIVDESYCGDEDEWKWSVYCMKHSAIGIFERVCQFRIQKKQPDVFFTEVTELGKSRGGFGSTGTK